MFGLTLRARCLQCRDLGVVACKREQSTLTSLVRLLPSSEPPEEPRLSKRSMLEGRHTWQRAGGRGSGSQGQLPLKPGLNSTITPTSWFSVPESFPVSLIPRGF